MTPDARAFVLTSSTSRWLLANLLNEFDAARHRTIEFATTAADTKELRRNFMPHPFFGELDCYQWFILAAGHSARHCNQGTVIKESAGFPRWCRSCPVGSYNPDNSRTRIALFRKPARNLFMQRRLMLAIDDATVLRAQRKEVLNPIYSH